MGLVFLTSFVLLVLTAGHFLVGMLGHKVSCRVLAEMGTRRQEPQQKQLYDFIDRNFPLTSLNPHGVVKDDQVTLSNIVRSISTEIYIHSFFFLPLLLPLLLIPRLLLPLLRHISD